MKRRSLAAILIVLSMIGCAARPAQRPEYTRLPPLESGWSRMYVSAGKMAGVKLWSLHQVGPVFINDQEVGSTAKDEHFVVDLLHGTYEAYCTPEQPDKNLIEKRRFTFKDGETRYFSCDMYHYPEGFGLSGYQASVYITRTYLEERPMGANSKLVSYSKLK